MDDNKQQTARNLVVVAKDDNEKHDVYYRCACFSKTFVKQFTEEKVWDVLSIKQEDGNITSKSVCVTNLTARLFCVECGLEIKDVPEPASASQRLPKMIGRGEKNGYE